MMNTRFGEFGGQYIPEILMSEINHVAEAYEKYKNDPAFKAELKDLYANYTGRPSMLYEAKRMRADLGGPKIYLKREDLNHTGAHKINNCIGQALLAKRMGKTRLIAETGAGQHGVAAATVAALLGMECEIFMGESRKIVELYYFDEFSVKEISALLEMNSNTVSTKLSRARAKLKKVIRR